LGSTASSQVATHPLRVLLVEDSVTDAQRMIRELRRTGREVTFERVDSSAAMRDALARSSWDVVIADWTMRQLGGLAAIDLVRQLQLDLPFITVSRTTGAENAVAALRAGAHDYVTKNKLGRLGPAVEREIREREIRRARQDAERAQRDGERRIRRMMEVARVGVWFFGAEGKTSFMNQRMAQILGMSAEEAALASVADFIDAEDLPGIVARLAERVDGSFGRYELRFRRKDGSVGWGEFEASPLYDGEGRFEGSLTVVTDITARRHSQEAHREAELRFTRLFESGITGVVLSDVATGMVTEANDTFLEMIGHRRDELLDGTVRWADRTPMEWRAVSTEALEDLRRGGKPRPFEKEYLHKDGSRVPALVGVTLLDQRRVLTVITDLTAQKLAEASLAARMRIATMNGDVGVALARQDTLPAILEDCCRAVIAHLGAESVSVWTMNAVTRAPELRAALRRENGDDRNPEARFDLQGMVKERRAHRTNEAATDAWVTDHAWARAEGMQAFAALPMLVAGELVGLISLFSRRPLTELEGTALETVTDTIAVRIRGRLAEAANVALEDQLRQSQKMDAIGRLAGGVAHDFNNLLSVILSYSEMLLVDLPEDNPARSDIEEIRRAGLRAADLTRQLLMFSRQQITEPKVMDLNDVLSAMDRLLRRVLGEDIQLTSLPGPLPGCVLADSSAIEQVVMNLVINARDAMPRGGTLTMETSNVVLDETTARRHLGMSPGPHVVLSVTDTGTGMDAATLARIFEPFFTTKARGQGTGLGLSMVFGIVQQSGGNVLVSSEPDVGTSFKVYLPRADGTAKTPALDREPGPLRGSETVLLVEDEDQVRDVAGEILRRHGYAVIEARTAAEALVASEGHPGPIQLLLTDVVMPEMGGPDLAGRLVELRPDMKVLCMSGYTDDAAVRHGMADAAFAYLQKPLTVDGLTKKVRDVLDARAERTPRA
jgi:two-component system, cell cycle sensor histidine kinase and response regulator CckA